MDKKADDYVEPVPPVAYITKIQQDGLFEISFSEDIYTVPNITMITNGTVAINGEELPVLHLEIEPGEDSDLKMLGFTWRVVSQTARKLVIQMIFDEPLFISANSDKEVLKATFRDPFMFTAKNGLQIKKEHWVI